MPALDLLLGTRRLRREIEAQSLQLGHDIERVKSNTTQLRRVTVARLTSPLGLLGAAAVGYIAGKKFRGRSSASPPPIDKHSLHGIAAAAINAARTIGLQVALPMTIEWIQSQFAKYKNEENATPNTSEATNESAQAQPPT